MKVIFFRRHVLQHALGILNKSIGTPLSSSHPLYPLSQENATVQQNLYFEHWHPEYEIPESSNVQDLHRHYDCQQFGHQFIELVPMSIGANVVGRNHDGSRDDMLMLTPSLGKPQNLYITYRQKC